MKAKLHINFAIISFLSFASCEKWADAPTEGGNVALPTSQYAPIKEFSAKALVVNLTEAGEIYIFKTRVEFQKTSSFLRERFRNQTSDIDIILQGSASASAISIIKVMDEVGNAGVGGDKLYLKVHLTDEKEAAFVYYFPTLDGYQRAPWYKIVLAADRFKRSQPLPNIFTEKNLPGYAMLTVVIRDHGYEILGRKVDDYGLFEALRDLRKKYNLIAVNCFVSENLLYQRLVNCLDVCGRAGLYSYVFERDVK